MAGQSRRSVADAYRRTEASVRRHANDHLPQALVMAAGRREDLRADHLLETMVSVAQEAAQALARAKEAGDERLVLAALREVRASWQAVAEAAPDRDTDHEAEWDAVEEDFARIARAIAATFDAFPAAGLRFADEIEALGDAETAANHRRRYGATRHRAPIQSVPAISAVALSAGG